MVISYSGAVFSSQSSHIFLNHWGICNTKINFSQIVLTEVSMIPPALTWSMPQRSTNHHSSRSPLWSELVWVRAQEKTSCRKSIKPPRLGGVSVPTEWQLRSPVRMHVSLTCQRALNIIHSEGSGFVVTLRVIWPSTVWRSVRYRRAFPQACSER